MVSTPPLHNTSLTCFPSWRDPLHSRSLHIAIAFTSWVWGLCALVMTHFLIGPAVLVGVATGRSMQITRESMPLANTRHSFSLSARFSTVPCCRFDQSSGEAFQCCHPRTGHVPRNGPKRGSHLPRLSVPTLAWEWCGHTIRQSCEVKTSSFAPLDRSRPCFAPTSNIVTESPSMCVNNEPSWYCCVFDACSTASSWR